MLILTTSPFQCEIFLLIYIFSVNYDIYIRNYLTAFPIFFFLLKK